MSATVHHLACPAYMTGELGRCTCGGWRFPIEPPDPIVEKKFEQLRAALERSRSVDGGEKT